MLYTQVSSLSVFSTGSSKEKIRIEVTSAKKLRISGEQPRTAGAGGSRRRFEMEFPIPPNCDVNAISANFVQGILYVKLPKKAVTPAVPVPVTTKEEKAPKQPTPEESSATAAPAVAPSQQKKELISDSGKEDVSKKSAEGRDVESKKINGAGDEAPKTTLEKEKDIKGLVDEEKKSVSQESDGKLAELAAKADGRGKTVSAREGETERGKDGRKVSRLEALAMVVKEPKRLINLVVGLLVAVVFALYVKDVIFQSLKGGSKRTEL